MGDDSGTGFKTLNVTFSETNYNRLLRWKERVEARSGGALTWAELLLLYANDTSQIPMSRK